MQDNNEPGPKSEGLRLEDKRGKQDLPTGDRAIEEERYSV